jgi:hypothetical protein
MKKKSIYSNKFLHNFHLSESSFTCYRKQFRDWLKLFTHLALVLLVIFTVASFFGEKVSNLFLRIAMIVKTIRITILNE